VFQQLELELITSTNHKPFSTTKTSCKFRQPVREAATIDTFPTLLTATLLHVLFKLGLNNNANKKLWCKKNNSVNTKILGCCWIQLHK